MSLIRFLSAGSRGLAPGVQPMGRYRLPDGRVIPNFGSAKNPFTSKNPPPRGNSFPATDVPAKAASTQAAPPSPSVFNPSAPATKQGGAWRRRLKGVAMWGPAWIGRLFGGILHWRPLRRARPVEPATRSGVRQPVQEELSLENIRVVRNDLSDSDFEVICADTATASPVASRRNAMMAAADRSSLGRLADRLFGTNTPE